MKKTLNEFEIGQSGVIKTVGGDGRIRRRLFDMGVTPDADVLLRKKAPLGDPLEVTIRGYELTLRKTEAEVVMCEAEDIKQDTAQRTEKKKCFLFKKKLEKNTCKKGGESL